MSEVSAEQARLRALRFEFEELVAGMCKAMNDPKRLLLLYALHAGPRSVGELSRIIAAPKANTSQHLAVLRDRGLVEPERQGNTVVYSLRHKKIIDALEILREIMNDELDRKQTIRLSPDTPITGDGRLLAALSE